MLKITKELLNWLRKSDQIVILKKNDGNFYLISDQYIHNRTCTTSENEIECNSTFENFHIAFYNNTGTGNPIYTAIQNLREGDYIKVQVVKHPIDDLMLYDVLLYVEHPYKKKFKDFAYLLYTTTKKYL